MAFILIRWTEVGGKASLLVQLQQQSEDRRLQTNAERVYLPSSVDFIHSTDPSGKLHSAQKQDFNKIFPAFDKSLKYAAALKLRREKRAGLE